LSGKVALCSALGARRTSTVNFDDFIRLLEVALWPTVAVLAILVVQPHLRALLSGAKIKLAIAGHSIETTLPELKQVIEEQTGAALSPEHVNYLATLQGSGAKAYPAGVEKSEDRKFLRPLRNAGLVATVPRNAFLDDAKAIELTALGRLYLRAKNSGATHVA
jgi:hypothetical protein